MVMHPQMVERIESALDEIRPALNMDGGTVELVEITPENVVKLAMAGACSGCPLSALTMKLGIERLLRERVPEITAIETEGVVDPEWA